MRFRRSLVLLPLLLTLAIGGSCKKAEDDDPITGLPAGAGLPTADPLLGVTGGELLADGEDRVMIVAQITDIYGRPLGLVPVTFTATNGAVISNPNDVTNFAGHASVELTSVASATDRVTGVCATVPDVVDSLTAFEIFFKDGEKGALVIPQEPVSIRIAAIRPAVAGKAPSTDEADAALKTAQNIGCFDVTMLGVRVVLSVANDRIPADGVRTTEVSAFLSQATSGIPISNDQVRFGTNQGRIDGEFLSDVDGEARAVLRSGTTPGTATIQAFVGVGLTAMTTVTFTPISFDLTATTAGVPADGVSGTPIVVTVLSQDRNPLSGLPIDFATNRGAITSPVLTDASGRAIATLTGDGAAGGATIVARFADAKSDSITVTFTNTYRPASVAVSVSPAAISADGASQATVTATVLDSLGGPVPDGTVVAFDLATGGGTLVSSATTDNGIATVRLTSPTTSGSATVRASVGGVSDTAPVVYTVGVSGTLQVSATPASLIGNGIETSMIVATVTDLFGNLVGPGVNVSFSANRGSITTSALTNDASQAMATYTSDVGAGTVKINVNSGSASGFVNVTLTSGAASQIVLMSVDRTSIGVKGSGDPESATMVFQVLSADGVPMGPATPITVNFVLTARTNGGGEFLQPASDVTDENGIVRTTLNSGSVSGVTKTIARIASPAIESRVIPISINGDLPVVRNLTVASQLLNIEGLCYYNIRTRISALVYDQFQNPVPQGTSVYFTSQYAGIQASDTTDDHGVADVDIISANELPPVWSGSGPSGFPYGFVEVYAQTADTNGTQIRDSTYVLFSGCSILENVSPASFAIADGGCQTFTFNLWDRNQNPLTGGTRINVSTTSGQLSGDIDVVLPDTQFGYTSFSFSLCDDSPGDLDPPIGASVSIRVTSKNGNVSGLVGGTID